jgi:hypothetical protein
MSTKVWYLEARDVHTNEVIAREVSAELTHQGVLCQDGQKRDFWECDYHTVAKLLRNETQAQLCFTVFYRECRNCPVKPWPFAKRKKPTLVQAQKKGLIKKGTS